MLAAWTSTLFAASFRRTPAPDFRCSDATRTPFRSVPVPTVLRTVFLLAAALAGSDSARAADPAPQTADFVIKGHTNSVQAIAYSPDGLLIATAGDDKTIRVWNATDGERQNRLSHAHAVCALAFTRDGKTILAGDKAGAVTYWDVATGEKRKSVEIGRQAVGFVTASPDGKSFAAITVGEYGATIRDVETGELRVTIKGHDLAMNALAFSPDGEKIATVGDNATVRVWSAADGKSLDELKAHDGYVHSVAFSPDGMRLATGGADKTVIVWDIKTGNVVKPVLEGHTGKVAFLAFLADGRLLSRAGTGETFAWKHPKGKPEVLARGSTSGLLVAGYYYPTDVAVSPDGRTLAFGRDKDVVLRPLSGTVKDAK